MSKFKPSTGDMIEVGNEISPCWSPREFISMTSDGYYLVWDDERKINTDKWKQARPISADNVRTGE